MKENHSTNHSSPKAQALQHRFDRDYRKGRPEISCPKVMDPNEPVSLWRFKSFEYIVRIYHETPEIFAMDTTLRKTLLQEMGDDAKGTPSEVQSALQRRWKEFQELPVQSPDWLAIRLEGILRQVPLNPESIELLLCAFLMENDLAILGACNGYFEEPMAEYHRRLRCFQLCTGLSHEEVVTWCAESSLLVSNDIFDPDLGLITHYQKVLLGLALMDHEVWGE